MDKIELLITSPAASKLAADLQNALPAAVKPEVRALSTRGAEQLVILTFIAEALKVTGGAIALVPIIHAWRGRAKAAAVPVKLTLRRGDQLITLEGEDAAQVESLADRIKEWLKPLEP